MTRKTIELIGMAALGLMLTGCASISVPMTQCKSNPNEAINKFDSIWFDGDGKGQWRFPWGFVAFETSGNLLLFKEHLEFRRSDGSGFEMRDIQSLTMKNLRMTFADPNQWMAIQYGLPPNTKEVYFMDGGKLGWRKQTGKMFDAIKAQYGK